jgi:N,N'-diacetylchitobiose transport system substrate-binding protein
VPAARLGTIEEESAREDQAFPWDRRSGDVRRQRLQHGRVAGAVFAPGVDGHREPGARGEPAGRARTLTVWLMNGSASDDLVKQLNTEFEAAHPGVTVKYEVQQWNGIVSRLNGALAAPQPPDVVETGNTQTAAYAAAGALLDVTDKRADSGRWLVRRQLVRG